MKNIITVLFLICFVQWGVAQKGLTYKVRTFGVGLLGNFGMSYPLSVNELGSGQLIEAAYPILDRSPGRVVDYEGNTLSQRYTYTLGAFAHYKHSLGSKFILTLEGGFSKTQVSHYLINHQPFSSRSTPFDAWHEWYNVNQYFAGLQLGFFLGGSKNHTFLNFGLRASEANIGEPLFEKDIRDYRGIQEPRDRSWQDPATTEGFTFSDQINTDVLFLTPSLKFLFQFGRYNSQAFEMGVAYGFALEENLISTQYSYFQNGSSSGQNLLNYKGDHLAFEISYTIPLIRSKRTIADSRQDKMRRQNERFQKRAVDNLKKQQQEETKKNSTKSNNNSSGNNKNNNKNIDPTYRPVIPSLQSCFNTSSTDNVRYMENHFQYNQSQVQFEVYHTDGTSDGDMISVCVDGTIALRNIKLSDSGNRFYVNTSGKNDINIVVYTHSAGSKGNVSLGISLLNGGQVNTIEEKAQANKYYWFKLERK